MLVQRWWLMRCGEPDRNDPPIQLKQLAHAVENGQQSANRHHEHVQSNDEILAQHLKQEKEQVQGSSTDRILVIACETTQNIRQGQKESD
uniref:Uncharacterized protein n=1 Tax=Physcomitrium patens TaxID=3218 RepID=A0A2K1KAX9_PHYPA|nr:hypothetical protein PHYPA_010120 [Physcomitrium patens]